MSGAADIMKAVGKTHGATIATRGDDAYEDVPRIPTGVFAVDLALGGGIPQSRVTIIWGNESSGKTNLVLKAIGQGQKMFPDKQAVFIDAEHAYDPKWAALLGVDTSRLIVIHPEYAEQAIDIIEQFLYATDVFIVALDSVAALSTQNEIDSSSEKTAVGGAALKLGTMFKKITVSFNKMRNSGLTPPAFVAINQVRNKIGVLYGSPDVMPGGFAQKFAASCIIRLHGKNEVDKSIHPVLPAYKLTTATITKWKFPILNTSVEFRMQMVSGGGKFPGHCEDWNTVSTYLKELDYLTKGEKGGWVMFGTEHKTLIDCKSALYGDVELLMETKAQIINELLLTGGLPVEPEPVSL